MKLLDAVTSNTTGTAAEIHNMQQLHSVFCYAVGDDFGGGNVSLQVSPDGTNWFTARTDTGAQATWTQSDVLTIFLQGHQMRAVLASATSPGAVTVQVY